MAFVENKPHLAKQDSLKNTNVFIMDLKTIAKDVADFSTYSDRYNYQNLVALLLTPNFSKSDQLKEVN